MGKIKGSFIVGTQYLVTTVSAGDENRKTIIGWFLFRLWAFKIKSFICRVASLQEWFGDLMELKIIF